MKYSIIKAAAAALTLAASTAGAWAEDLTKIRYGYLPIPLMPLFAAEAHGLFEKHGVDVELIKFTSGPAEFQSLQAGSIDLAQGALAAFYMASSRGLDAKWVYTFGDAGPIEGFVLAEGTNIESYADLKGKKISAPSGSILHLYHVSQALDAGLEVSDIEFISLPPPQAVPAVENGNVDASWFWEPFITISSEKGAKEMYRARDVGLSDFFGIAASGKWLDDEANQAALARMLNAMEEGVAMYEQDPAPTLAKVEEFTGIKQDLATRIIDGIDWASLAKQTEADSPFNMTTEGAGAHAQLQWVQDRALAAELMDKPGDLDNFLDSRAVSQASK
ncbi:ABC transporter substrate-binding protein [Ruegeria jejuensis]|uniref:ABC transporter substrate-binding protein n=1 Tax=Ruegeria jejuensis TaxID=3233338 RepID=UPI00355BF7BE